MTAYHVSTSGNNANNGSEGSPRRNINNGLALLTTPSDILYVRGGTYHENVDAVDKVGTNFGGGIYTLSSYPGETATVIAPDDSQGIVLTLRNCVYFQVLNMVWDGTNVTGGVIGANFPGTEFIKIQGNEIKNCGLPNFHNLSGGAAVNHNGFTGGQNSQIINNNFHHNHKAMYCSSRVPGSSLLVEGNTIWQHWSYGIHGSGGPEVGSGYGIFRNNRIFENGQSGFQNGQVGNQFGDGLGIFYTTNGITLVYNNLIYNNFSTGIRVQYPANNGPNGGAVRIYNNTVFGNQGRDGSVVFSGGILGGDSAVPTDIQNNIAFNNNGFQIQNQTSGLTDHNITVDPLFVDPANGDFRLKTGSPAIDAGINLSSIFTTDFFGTVRG